MPQSGEIGDFKHFTYAKSVFLLMITLILKAHK